MSCPQHKTCGDSRLGCQRSEATPCETDTPAVAFDLVFDFALDDDFDFDFA